MAKQNDDGSSPYVRWYLARRQAEQVLELLSAQPQRKWDPVLRSLLRDLRKNAGGRLYSPAAPGTGIPTVSLRAKR